MNEQIKKIEDSWEMEEGFFYLLRNQHIDFEKGENILHVLENINFEYSDNIKCQYVKVLWYIPIFMEWQFERIKELYSETVVKNYINLQALMLNEIERILGTP